MRALEFNFIKLAHVTTRFDTEVIMGGFDINMFEDVIHFSLGPLKALSLPSAIR